MRIRLKKNAGDAYFLNKFFENTNSFKLVKHVDFTQRNFYNFYKFTKLIAEIRNNNLRR